MIHQTYPETLTTPAEYEYSDPVDCFVCHTEFDREGHRMQLFDLDGVTGNDPAICDDCDIRCEWCGESVLEYMPCKLKFVDGVWMDDKPYHHECVGDALCQEGAA